MVAPKFEAAGEFRDGLAAVRLNRQLGYIDTRGNLVWLPEE
ncbi:MAG: WG repeat-containing protein [bacterium]